MCIQVFVYNVIVAYTSRNDFHTRWQLFVASVLLQAKKKLLCQRPRREFVQLVCEKFRLCWYILWKMSANMAIVIIHFSCENYPLCRKMWQFNDMPLVDCCRDETRMACEGGVLLVHPSIKLSSKIWRNFWEKNCQFFISWFFQNFVNVFLTWSKFIEVQQFLILGWKKSKFCCFYKINKKFVLLTPEKKQIWKK